MKSKGIVIIGAPGSGKTYFEEELYKWTDFQEPRMFFRDNVDDLVENEDGEFYNNPLKASTFMYKTIIPNQQELGWNFILQSTGANVNTLRKIIEYPNYEFKIIVIYCNPIIAFLRNFSRERKLPKEIVLNRWLEVYSNIQEYINMLGKDNIYIYGTEYTEEELNIVNKKHGWYTSCYKTLKDFDKSSSFIKNKTNYIPKEIESKQEKFHKLLEEVDSKIQKIENQFIDFDLDKKIIKDNIAEWILI